jgi:hypothetical protein
VVRGLENNSAQKGMTMGMPNYNDFMTLGELITFLEGVEDRTKMVITTGGTYVSGFSSYRGYYEELAIVPSGGYSGKSLNVGELLDAANEADGAYFTGWKGGDFGMSKLNALWLSFEGECTGIGIKKAKETDYSVVLYGKISSDT